MILKALYDYYHRSGDNVAPLGLEYKEIGFIIVIDKDGNLCRIEDNPVKKLVAKTNGRTGTKSLPNHLWDNFSYVLGISNATIHINDEGLKPEKEAEYKKEIAKNVRNHSAFLEYINDLCSQYPYDEDLKAVANFYIVNKDVLSLLQKADNWDNIKKNFTKNISFLIQGETQIIAEKESVLSYYKTDEGKTDFSRICVCLVTGEKCQPVKTFTKIQLGKFSDTKLVSFQKNQGYDSYGKEQGNNAPMSKSAEFAIAAALKKLIDYNSHNKFTVGLRTYAFWASRKNEVNMQIEESVYSLFGWEEKDNPDSKLENITQIFKSIYNGNKPIQTDDKFYILGMFAANKARIAISYWNETTVKEFAGKLLLHFEDMEIITSGDKRPNYCSLYAILKAVSLKENIKENCPPSLPDAVVKSIFQGLPYPVSLFQACVCRIRAKQSVNIVHAAIIKAYLNRLNDNNNNKKLDIMLDKDNQNQGYLCGRLFAVMENLQYAANKQDTIRSSYLNAASSTPSAVFPTILKLSNSHYSKLAKDKKGLANFFDDQKKEIIALIQDFPNTLNLSDQGRFFLGYYHQKCHRDNKEAEE